MSQSANGTWRQRVPRDTVAAMGVLLGLLGLAFVLPFQALQIPGYLLLLGYLPVQAVVGDLGTSVLFYVLFAAYLLVLSVVGSVFAGFFRRRTRPTRVANWRFGVAGGLAVAGVLALTVGVRILLDGATFTPALISTGSGLVLLGLASLFAGMFGEDRSAT